MNDRVQSGRGRYMVPSSLMFGGIGKDWRTP
jgi:hypothetical protein